MYCVKWVCCHPAIKLIFKIITTYTLLLQFQECGIATCKNSKFFDTYLSSNSMISGGYRDPLPDNKLLQGSILCPRLL